MNWPKFFILIPVFYLLLAVQTTFLLYFPLILISVFLINLFEKPQDFTGVLVALIGGFFLDIFSSGIIGIHALSLAALALLIKVILRRYVRSPVY
ncbi:MAG: hypothetical protein DRZ76_01495 [Candidatus Nealsonbacteria bacterium]|nr:MAG: hypothetical protein DRZ76_01495 [Candidatus Nealsonbacteria bacterium]